MENGESVIQHVLKIAASFCFTWLCVAQNVPTTQAKALDGSTVIFPKSHGQKPLLLMIGFSHKSSGDFDTWNKQVLSSYLSDPHVEYYEMTDLQGVPSFVKPMIFHGMRREIHGTERAHFVPFVTGENGWKKTVSYSKPEYAYLIVADASGLIVWQTHGHANEKKVAELKAALRKLTSSTQ